MLNAVMVQQPAFYRPIPPPLALLDRSRCPACLSHFTFSYPGVDFTGCFNCDTIAARDRRTTVTYDREYIASRYDKYKTTRMMSNLRLQVLEGVLHLHESLTKGFGAVGRGALLDVGYGNGDFIRVARDWNWGAYGYDVNRTEYDGVRRHPLPNKPDWPYHYRAITFFDSLEHFENLENARFCSHATDWLLLSFPAVPDTFPGDLNFRHYRPGEHHLFFQPKGLEKIFSHGGVKAELVYCETPEDSIRTRWNVNLPNIWTVALRCRNANS